MNQDPYATLGVPKDAGPAEVRRAYLKAQKKAHPDAGGSHEAAVAVAVAYRLLNDPAARERYDRTGDTRQEDPKARAKRAVTELVLTIIGKTDEGCDIVASAVKHCERVLAQQHAAAEDAMEQALRYERAAKRLKRAKGGDNLLSQAALGHGRELRRMFQQIKAATEDTRAMLEVLADYRCEAGPQANNANPFGMPKFTVTFR